MNECVAPVSIITIRETPLIRHTAQIKLSDLVVFAPLEVKTFPTY